MAYVQVLLRLPSKFRPADPLHLVEGLVALLPRPLHRLHLPLPRLSVLGSRLHGPIGLFHLLFHSLSLQLLSPGLQLGLILKYERVLFLNEYLEILGTVSFRGDHSANVYENFGLRLDAIQRADLCQQ